VIICLKSVTAGDKYNFIKILRGVISPNIPVGPLGLIPVGFELVPKANSYSSSPENEPTMIVPL
jgi:hypothetical protein